MPTALRRSISRNKPYSSLSELSSQRTGIQRESPDTTSSIPWSRNSKGGLNALYSQLARQTSHHTIFNSSEIPSQRQKRRSGGGQVASSDGDSSLTSFYPRGRPTSISYVTESRDEQQIPERKSDGMRVSDELENESLVEPQNLESYHCGEYVQGHSEEDDLPQQMPTFKPRLPAWLHQRAAKEAGRDTLLQEGNMAFAAHHESMAGHTRHHASSLLRYTSGYGYEEGPPMTAIQDIGSERGFTREQPVDMFSSPRAVHAASRGLCQEISGPVLQATQPTSIQPFTTPGPYAARQLGNKQKKNHDRYLPTSANAPSPTPFERYRSTTPISTVSIEPTGYAKPFSKPFIQTQEGLSLPDRYAGNGKRDLFARAIIGLPTIEEELAEHCYSSMSAQEDCFHMPEGTSDLNHGGGDARDRELSFSARPTSPDSTTEPILHEPSPGTQLPSSTGPFFDQSYEVMSDAKSYSQDQRDGYESLEAKTGLAATTPDVAMFGSGPDRPASSLERTHQSYYFSDDNGEEHGSHQTYLEGPRSTGILDVDALEAAAAAASEESRTAIGGPVEDTVIVQEQDISEQPSTARKQRKHTRLATTQMKNTELIAQSPARGNILSIASSITKGAVRHHAKKQSGAPSPTQAESNRDETGLQVEDLESIASFGDGGPDRLSANTGDFESEGLQDGAGTIGGHASFSSSGKMAYSDAGDDSACMMTREKGYPGFDVWQDEECK